MPMEQKPIPYRHQLRCLNASRYRAMKPPRCNGGRPCQYCRELWKRALENKALHAGALTHGVSDA